VVYEGFQPDSRLEAYIEYQGGGTSPHIAYTVPPAISDHTPPLVRDFDCNGTILSMRAGDDTGIRQIEYFANGTSIGIDYNLRTRQVLLDEEGLTYRVYGLPIVLQGPVIFEAIITDLLGNTTRVSTHTTLPE
jgi:hypothetical protein